MRPSPQPLKKHICPRQDVLARGCFLPLGPGIPSPPHSSSLSPFPSFPERILPPCSLDLGKSIKMREWAQRGRIPKIWKKREKELLLKVDSQQKADGKAKLAQVVKLGEREVGGEEGGCEEGGPAAQAGVRRVPVCAMRGGGAGVAAKAPGQCRNMRKMGRRGKEF